MKLYVATIVGLVCCAGFLTQRRAGELYAEAKEERKERTVFPVQRALFTV